jgi:hypothetical protein
LSSSSSAALLSRPLRVALYSHHSHPSTSYQSQTHPLRRSCSSRTPRARSARPCLSPRLARLCSLALRAAPAPNSPVHRRSARKHLRASSSPSSHAQIPRQSTRNRRQSIANRTIPIGPRSRVSRLSSRAVARLASVRAAVRECRVWRCVRVVLGARERARRRRRRRVRRERASTASTSQRPPTSSPARGVGGEDSIIRGFVVSICRFSDGGGGHAGCFVLIA